MFILTVDENVHEPTKLARGGDTVVEHLTADCKIEGSVANAMFFSLKLLICEPYYLP